MTPAVLKSAHLLEFVLKVDGEYATGIQAASIEDAQALAMADERLELATARLVEVGNTDNQIEFEVGK